MAQRLAVDIGELWAHAVLVERAHVAVHCVDEPEVVVAVVILAQHCVRWPAILDARLDCVDEGVGLLLQHDIRRALHLLAHSFDQRREVDELPLVELPKDRLVLAAEAEVEESLRNLETVSRSTRVYGSVPSEIVLLSIPEANQWVRKLVDEAKVYRDGRGASQRISIWIRLKNGVRLSVGDASVGLKSRV